MSGTTVAAKRTVAKPEIAAKKFQAHRLDKAGIQRLPGGCSGGVNEGRKGAPARALAPDAERRLPALLPRPLADHGARARKEAPRHLDVPGPRIDDRTATIHADLSHLGFHASIRSSKGAWYIDPYYHLDQSVYVSYYGRDLSDTDAAPFVERDATSSTADRQGLRPRV